MYNLLESEHLWTFGIVTMPCSDLIQCSSEIYDCLKSKTFRNRFGFKKSRLIPVDDLATLFHAISLQRWSHAQISLVLLDRHTKRFDSSIKAFEKFSQKIRSPFRLTHRWQHDGEETTWYCSFSPNGKLADSSIGWEFSSLNVDPEAGSEHWENEWRCVAEAMGVIDILIEEQFEKIRYPEHRTADRISYLPHDQKTRVGSSFYPGSPLRVSLSLSFPSDETDEILAEFARLQEVTRNKYGKTTTRLLDILAGSDDAKSYTEDFGLPKMLTYVDYNLDDDSPRYSSFSAKLAASNVPVALPVYGMTALKDDEEIAVALVNAVHVGSPLCDVCLEIQTQQGPELLKDLAQVCGFEISIWSGDAEGRWGWFD